MRVPALLLALMLAGLVVGCKEASRPSATLTFLLPEYHEYPDREPPRLFKLTIDGEDHTSIKDKTPKEVSIAAPRGNQHVEVVLSFWPVSYSNTIRTRKVQVQPGDQLEVDLSKEDPETPDRFEPIYFPAAASLMEEMMKLAHVGKDDIVMDIGCGDGRIVFTAVKKFHAKKGIGIDIREELVKLCQDNAKKEGVADRTEFSVQDALKLTDLSHVSVVFLYLGEDLSARLQPLLQKTLKPGARVVSLDFPIGDWKPDTTKKFTAKRDRGGEQTYKLHLWTVKDR